MLYVDNMKIKCITCMSVCIGNLKSLSCGMLIKNRYSLKEYVLCRFCKLKYTKSEDLLC